MKTWLIFGGKTGWIGGKICDLLNERAYENRVVCAESRLENVDDMRQEIERVKPHYVVNCAGITGRPNIDWCEDHEDETYNVNYIGTRNLLNICEVFRIFFVNFGTGCIYEYDDDHPVHSGIGFTEDEEPNFRGSVYSRTKILMDQTLRFYPYCRILNLRIRMPISDDLHHRSFVTKIVNYEKVVNIPNSMTVLYDLLPVAIEMAERGIQGTFNFTNPGVVSHNEVLDLYKEYIDPEYSYENFTVEEQAKVIKAGRSNNELDVSKLLSVVPDIPDIKTSLKGVFKRMKTERKKSLYKQFYDDFFKRCEKTEENIRAFYDMNPNLSLLD